MPPDPTRRREKAKPLRLQDTVRLSAEGLGKVLGDLEARVMRIVWEMARPAPSRAVYERVLREHEVAHLTVITVLNKLVEKGLLSRTKLDGLFHYAPRVSEEEFVAQVSRRVVEGILSFGPEAVAASFVDVLAERDRDRLLELQRLIQARLEAEEA